MMYEDNVTLAWQRYNQCKDYKNSIGYYSEVDENYNYYQGDQWGGVESNGLPKPVFNVIKPVIRYKVAMVQQNDTAIMFTSENTQAENYKNLAEIAEVLTNYGKVLWEKCKMDFHNEQMLTDAAISGNGFSYHYFDYSRNEIKMELIDGNNVYPANPNVADIQDQEYIVLAFRKPLSDVKREAENNRKNKLNKLTADDIDCIMADTDTNEQAADGKNEITEYEKCTVLLMFWKDYKTNTVHYSKSVRSYEITKDTDLQLTRYPIAMMTWENRKNCFFGISDAKALIPNQDYINTIAAMIMASTTFTSFPKMVYNSDMVDDPNTEIGVAIGVSGANMPINNAVGYISPAGTGSDAFKMFEETISLTKDLMGANDSALGSVNPEQASGKAILALQEQAATPLGSVKNRFYNYIEDVALIWAELWRVYHSADGKIALNIDENGEQQIFKIDAEAFNQLMLSVKVEVGPASRWSEIVQMKILENLLSGKHIDLEFFVQCIPSSSGFPKAQMTKHIQQMRERQQIQTNPKQAIVGDNPVDETVINQMVANNTPDIDELLGGLSEEEIQQALQNPEFLKNIILQKMELS